MRRRPSAGLSAAIGLGLSRFGRGRRTILRSAIDHQDVELIDQETAGPEKSPEELVR